VGGTKRVWLVDHLWSRGTGLEFDTGPLLVTELVPLDINEDYQDLKKKMPEVFSRMVTKVIDLALEGAPGEPQVGTGSYAPKFDNDFRWIDFKAQARDVHNKVRAFYGERDHPKGALAKIDGETICLTKTRLPVRVKLLQVPTDTTAVTTGHSDNDGSSDMASLASTASTTGSSNTGTDSSVIIPGTVLAFSPRERGHSFFVQCGDTSLEVLEWHKVEE
jgi:hypothetical protein